MSVHRGYAAASFGQVHYRYAGTPGMPVIVLLHQTPSTSEMFEDLMLALADDYRLIAPDTPGMGMSDALPGTMTVKGLAAGIAEVLDEIGVDECVLFGHHTGAAIAAELAAKHPRLANGLILAGPPLLDDELRQALPAAGAPIPVEADGSHMLKMWQRIARKDPDVPLSVVLRDALSGLRIGERYLAAYQAVIAHDFAATVEAVSCPTLVFAGTKDILYSAVEPTLALLRDGEMATIEDAWSFFCETHVDEVANLVRSFTAAEAPA